LITHDEYKEAQVRLYGITDPVHIERGKEILGDEKNDVAFFEGAQSTLIALKDKGFLLGIVTDTAHSVQAKLSWFERGGIGHVWDSIISSKEVGARKPDPKIYRAVLDQLGIQGHEAVFVGHKASELSGAKALGMKTIAFNYEQDAEADYYLEKFSDLLEVPIIS
jgi:putative hydrolase of the HAD superfamily